jgi:hypothetical protein
LNGDNKVSAQERQFAELVKNSGLLNPGDDNLFKFINEKAMELSKPKDRRVFKDAEGYQRYEDGSRLYPDADAPSNPLTGIGAKLEAEGLTPGTDEYRRRAQALNSGTPSWAIKPTTDGGAVAINPLTGQVKPINLPDGLSLLSPGMKVSFNPETNEFTVDTSGNAGDRKTAAGHREIIRNASLTADLLEDSMGMIRDGKIPPWGYGPTADVLGFSTMLWSSFNLPFAQQMTGALSPTEIATLNQNVRRAALAITPALTQEKSRFSNSERQMVREILEGKYPTPDRSMALMGKMKEEMDRMIMEAREALGEGTELQQEISQQQREIYELEAKLGLSGG